MNNTRIARAAADMLQVKERAQMSDADEEAMDGIQSFLSAARPTRGDLEALFYDELPEEKQRKIDEIMRERDMAAAIDKAIAEGEYE